MVLGNEKSNIINDLKSSVWIYDIDNFCILWANAAGLELWEADSLAELKSRDFGIGSSDAVRTTLVNYQKAFQRGEVLSEIWTITPKGALKEVYLIMSGYKLNSGSMAMLCEAIEPKLVSSIDRLGGKVMMSSFQYDGTFISSNPPFKYEISAEPITLNQIIADSLILDAIYDDLNINNYFEGEVLCNVGNKAVWYHLSIHLLQSDMDRKGKILIYQHNIHDKKLQELVYRTDQFLDSLTGLINRKGLLDKAEEYCEKGTSFVLYYIDLDGFKVINDSFGHEGGDKILQWVATNLFNFCSVGEVCRFGGDEFIWICPLSELPLPPEKQSAALLASISRPYRGDLGVSIDISASIGSAIYPQDGQTKDGIIYCADAAMYVAKFRGKHQVVSYEAGMEKESKRQGILAQHLSQAIERGELSLRYQAVYDATKEQITSYEVLLDWYNNSLGPISAEDTLKVAQDIGLVQQVEDWMIELSFKELPILRQKSNSQATLSLNISGSHVSKVDFVHFLKEKLIEMNLKPQDIVIELEEFAFLKDIDSEQSAAEMLKELGVGICIDNFGIGNMSLIYLHRVPADFLKINRRFLQEFPHTKNAVEYIQRLASSLDIKVLADGVETEEQQSMLKQLKVDFQQGPLYSHLSQ